MKKHVNINKLLDVLNIPQEDISASLLKKETERLLKKLLNKESIFDDYKTNYTITDVGTKEDEFPKDATKMRLETYKNTMHMHYLAEDSKTFNSNAKTELHSIYVPLREIPKKIRNKAIKAFMRNKNESSK